MKIFTLQIQEITIICKYSHYNKIRGEIYDL